MIPKSAIFLPLATLFASCVGTSPFKKVVIHRGTQPIQIESRTYWNDTGIHLQSGNRYQFHVRGTWKDWTYQATSEGPASPFVNAMMFPTRPLLRYSPLRDICANYFQPIGTIGRCEGKALPLHAFIIRDGMTYAAPVSGILHVFANDAPWESAYANNQGSLELTVSEFP